MTNTGILVGGYNPDEIFRKKAEQVQAERDIEAERRKQEESRAAESSSASKSDSAKGTKPARQARFTIKEYGDYYRIGGLTIGNTSFIFDLAKQLLLAGETRTHDQWVDHQVNILDERGRRAPTLRDLANNPLPLEIIGSASIYIQLFGLLYDNRNGRSGDTVLAARADLETLLSRTSITTMTSVEYNPQGINDRVIVCGGEGGILEYDDLTGWTGTVHSIAKADVACKAIFGASANRLNEICGWIGGAAILTREKTKPAFQGTYAVQLGVINRPANAFLISAYTPLTSHAPALGIRYAKIEDLRKVRP